MLKVDFKSYKRIMQAFWDSEPKNDDTSATSIWCLGKEYVSKSIQNEIRNLPEDQEAEATQAINGKSQNHASEATIQKIPTSGLMNGHVLLQQGEEIDLAWPSDFLDDCEARAWFTYRSSFPPIKKSSEASMTLSVRLRSLSDQGGFTSDTGWGCMIRSGQSLLANALITLRLGRNWRRGIRQDEERQILSLFADDPTAPFSIHRFVEHGASACGKHPGEWFGPSATARCIQALSDKYREAGLKVYINGDGADVYEDKFLKLAKSEDKFTPTLILVGVRLGIERINPVYWDALKESLRLPHSVGIAGGRPSSSHYFFAIQGDQSFYLDPHFTRPALPLHANLANFTDEEVDSCHTRRLRRLPLKDMDPSMLIAFLIEDENDWQYWRQAVSGSSGKSVVHVADAEPSLHGLAERPSALDDVETFDDEEEGGVDDVDGEMVQRPPSHGMS